jgi:hypothetical protein
MSDSVRVLIFTFLNDEGEPINVLVSDFIVPWEFREPCRVYARREDGRFSVGPFIDDDAVDGAVAVESWGRRHIDTRVITIPAGFDYWTETEVAAFVSEAFRIYSRDMTARASLRLAAECAVRDSVGRFIREPMERGVLAGR